MILLYNFVMTTMGGIWYRSYHVNMSMPYIGNVKLSGVYPGQGEQVNFNMTLQTLILHLNHK